MNNNAFLSSNNVENIIKILTPHRNSLHIIALSDEVIMELCIKLIYMMIFVKECNRKNNMNICTNCENLHWNKVKRDKRKCNNYYEQIKAGTQTKVVSLSPERLKKRIKNEYHRRKVSSSLNLQNAQKKLDNLKDEVEAKDDEGGDISLLLKKGFEQSDDKMDYKKQ